MAGQSASLTARLDYDTSGRIAAITYPTPAGAPSFVVARDYDSHGYAHTVRDSVTNAPYWRLTDVDNAGRFREEVFGNGVSTERSYVADKQSLGSIVTHGATTVQDLAYGYDGQRNLASRTDALQPLNKAERFRYDALQRLTCAYFSPTESASVPCALGYGYDPNGNLTSKSDVGTLVYDVHSPERVVAIVTRGGAEAGTRYVHVDHLGSGDALTKEDGSVVERRSYDPFGQRRNPEWGKPVPASFASLTTLGFTGHESDEELGLVNMKGRIFDPKVGRFLTTDPLVSAPLSGQSWNPYSYVFNNRATRQGWSEGIEDAMTS